jgi:hypothetical protein
MRGSRVVTRYSLRLMQRGSRLSSRHKSEQPVSADQDWRLKAELDAQDRRSTLDHLLGHVRGPSIAGEVGESVPHDVAITHDGSLLFAYAPTESALTTARRAIEAVLRRDGIGANVSVSHWDDRFDEWLQVDPPLTGEAKRAEEAKEHDAEQIESRTMVASAGNLIRAEVEQTMREAADRLGLRCELIEHPHLLRTQIAFTVTGPRRKIDEFSQDLIAEGWATIRAEMSVLMSPL